MANNADVQLVIPGEPTAKGRSRFVRATGQTYTPEKTVKYETLIQELFAIHYPDHKPFEGPAWMRANAYMAIPKSASKKRREAMLAGKILPTKRPDIDNFIKIAGDALNELAFKDDCQIVSVRADKTYSDQPRMVITLGPIHNGGSK